MLCRHGRAADDEEVDPGVDNGAPMSLGVLGAQRTGDGHAGGAQLTQSRGDELGTDRFAVDLLHPRGRPDGVEAGDLLEDWLGVVVTGPDPFEVEHRQATEPTERDGGGRRHDRVHRRTHDGDVEVVGVDLPRHRDVLRVAGASRGDDRDLFEGVGTAAAFAAANLDLGHDETLPGHR